jgi:hypothetical protein
MSNHLLTRPGGVWADDTDLLHTEMADIDAKTVDSISATGGTYAITENLIIGGSPGTYLEVDVSAIFINGASVQGTFETFGPVGMYDDVTIGSGVGDLLSVQSLANFAQGASMQGVLECFNGVGLYEDVTIGSGVGDVLSVNSVSTFYDDVAFNDVATFNSLADFNDQATFYEQVVFQGPIVLTGEARIKQRQAIGGNADATYDAKTYTHVHVPAGTLSAARSYTIGDTGAQNGDRIRFSTLDTGFGITIRSPSGAAVGSTLIATTGDAGWIDVERIQGQWVVA